MKVGIIGTGAMATLFASRLAHAFDVTLVGSWAAQIAAINAHGLRVMEQDGSETHHALHAVDVAAPGWAEHVSAELVIVLTKSYQTIDSAERIRACLAPNGLVVTLQNGLGNLELLSAELPNATITAGTTSVGATSIASGAVRYAGIGSTVIAAPKTLSPQHQKYLFALVRCLNRRDLLTELVENVTPLLWGKVIINVGINPLTALLNVSNGHLTTNSAAHLVMQAAVREATEVAHALKIALPYNDSIEAVVTVAQATSANRSSMLQDITRGAPTEIDAICGAIIRHGQQLKIPTPVNQLLLNLIIERESTPSRHTQRSQQDVLSMLQSVIIPHNETN